MMFHIGPNIEKIWSSGDHGTGRLFPYGRHYDSILRSFSVLHGNDERTNFNIFSGGRSSVKIGDAGPNSGFVFAHYGGSFHCGMNDNIRPVGGVKFVSAQVYLASNETPLGYADTYKTRSQKRENRRKSGDGVCPEFLQPALIIFGKAATMFAGGFYIQGRRRTDADFVFGGTITILGPIGLFSLLLGDWWSPVICLLYWNNRSSRG